MGSFKDEGSGLENSLHRVIDMLPGLVWTALPDGRADFVNKRWCDYTGLSFGEACGDGWHAAVHPSDRLKLLEAWQSLANTAEIAELEARLRRYDGEYRWFAFRTCQITDASGAVVKWCGINTEIEHSMRSEEALVAQEHRAQLIVDGIPAIVSLVTNDGQLENANRLMLDYCGETLEVLKSRPIGYNVHPEDRPDVLRRWWRSVETGAPYDCKARMRGKDGIYRWFHDIGFPIRDSNGRIVVWYLLQIDIDDLKRSEEKLRRSEALLTEAQRLSQTGSFYWRPDTDEVILSEELLRILEFEPGSSVSLERAGSRIHPDDRSLLAERIAEARADGSAKDFAIRLRTPYGQVKHLRTTYQALRIDRRPEIIGVVHDVTRRMLSDEELRRINAYVSDAQRMNPTSIFRWKVTTDEHIWSEGVYRMFEFDPSEEITLALILEKIHPEDSPLVDGTMARVSAGLDFELNFRAIMRGGSIKHVHVVAQPIGKGDGQLEYFGAVQDVSERRQTEEQLRRSEALMAEAQKLSHTGSFVFNAFTGETEWSAEVYRIYEIDPATKATSQTLPKIIHPDDLPAVEQTMEALTSTGQDFALEFRVVLAGGKIKHTQVVGHRIPTQDGHLEYIGAVQDVTEIRVAEQALSKVRSELTHMARISSLGELTASIAHEVNQPLSGIITNAGTCLRLLANEPPNVSGAVETARRIVRDGDRASDVVKRLRALFSKRSTANELVDLNGAASDVVALSRSDLQRNRIAVHMDLAEDLPPVTGDRVQLQQVILNLLLNAADAVRGVDDRPRQVVIRTEREEADRVRLAVQDSGVGIERDVAERLFEAFFTTKAEGMGIGLSISRTIIDNHGGRIWAEAKGGPGATFAFSIPCGS